MIQFSFNSDEGFLEVIYEGVIHADDIISVSTYISESKDLPRDLRILTDARMATYDFSPQTVERLAELLENSIRKYDCIKDAFIHKNPRETAYSMLLELENRYDTYSHKVFTNREAAVFWLSL